MDITDKINEESKEPIKTRLFSTEPFEEEKKEETDSLNEDVSSLDDDIIEKQEEKIQEIISESIETDSDDKITDKNDFVVENVVEEYTEEKIQEPISDENRTIIEDVHKDVIENPIEKATLETAPIDEEIEKFEAEEITEPRHIVISADDSSFESGLEIKYTSLQLRNFPIKYKNFSEKMDFDEIVNIGNTSIKIGNTVIHNTSLKILVYSKFKLLEIKTREFKLALSIELNDKQTLVKKDDYFKYEIYDKVKTSRLGEVVDIFKKIFSGENLTFKYNQLMGNIVFENRLEVYKFTIVAETISSYKFITKELELYKEKNINYTKDTFYSLFLLNAYMKGEELSNWVNFRIKNNYNILPGDILSFEKIHKLQLHGINFDLKEHVKLVEPISSREINEKNEICCYRKAVEITLEKIKKI